MSRLVVFGGTTEGRALFDFLEKAHKPAVVCVATEYGAKQLAPGSYAAVLTGRLDKDAMAALFLKETPPVVVDATHPYAAVVSHNIKSACEETGTPYLRVKRQVNKTDECARFETLGALVAWLEQQEGTIFVTTGAKEAAAFTALSEFEKRVYVRILPSLEGLSDCLKAGYPAKHIVCMQGPFSKALNEAMFESAGARILVTKESGAQGGFDEKVQAAKVLGMRVALLARPGDAKGLSLEETMERLMAL